MIERITSQWLAGFFDGEGSISVVRRKTDGQVYVKISLAQNDKGLMEAIQVLYPEFSGPTIASGKCWHIYANGRKATRFLKDIEPFTIRKFTQVVLAIEFISKLDWARGNKTDPNILLEKERLATMILEARKTDSIAAN